MSKHIGMPGPGGSLGRCALCGGNFLAAVLGVGKAISFTIPGCNQILYAHPRCIKDFNGKEWTELPPESPLRKAYESQPEKEIAQ